MSDIKKHWSDYTHSLRFNTAFLLTLCVDALYIALIGTLFYLAQRVLLRILATLTGGRTVEQFQQYFYSLSPGQLEIFKSQAETVVYLLALILVVLPLLSFILYGLSNSLVWHIISNRPFIFRKHWKWNLMHFVLAVIGIVLIVCSIIIRQVSIYFLPSAGPWLSNIFTFAAALFFLVLLFLLSYHFLHTHKVGQSLTLAFDTLRQKFKDAAIVSLLAGLTLFIVRFAVLYPFRFQFIIYPTAGTIIGLAIFLLWLAWFRMYSVKTLFQHMHQ